MDYAEDFVLSKFSLIFLFLVSKAFYLLILRKCVKLCRFQIEMIKIKASFNKTNAKTLI
jgi:hypothetical protein